MTYEKLGQSIGKLVDEKNKAYGNSFERSGDILKILYPDGISPEQYISALVTVRILDKMFRIATDPTYGGEEPFKDIAGYGILMANFMQKLKPEHHDKTVYRIDESHSHSPNWIKE